MFDNYVNQISALSDNKMLSALSSINGLLGLSVLGLLTTIGGVAIKLYKALKKTNSLEMSRGLLEADLKEKTEIIHNYQKVFKQQTEAIESYERILPADIDKLHVLYHLLILIVRSDLGAACKRDPEHIGDADEAFKYFSDMRYYLIKAMSTKLIFQKKYSCIRYFVSLSQLDLLMHSIGAKLLTAHNIEHSISTENITSGEFDLAEVNILFELAKNFNDIASLDILLCIKVSELSFAIERREDYENELYSKTLAEDLRDIINSLDVERMELVRLIPNTLIAVLFNIKKIGNGFQDFLFEKELLAAMGEFARSPEPPPLLQMLAGEFYKDNQSEFQSVGSDASFSAESPFASAAVDYEVKFPSNSWSNYNYSGTFK